MSSYKRIVFLIFLCLMALLCVSCASVKKHEYVPLDYTREDVRNNEINQISALLKKEPIEAMWRSYLLKASSPVEDVGVEDLFTQCQEKVYSLCENYVQEEKYLDALQCAMSLESVGFTIPADAGFSRAFLETSLLENVPGKDKNTTEQGSVSSYISGTVTIWVDLGIQVQKGLGYASRSIGSGFFIDEKGYIVTNYHVIQSEVDPKYEGYSRLYIKLSSNPEVRIPARVVGWDPLLDLALLKTEVDAPYVFSLGSSSDLDVGDKIYAIGSPLGLEWTMTSGIVSAANRQLLSMGPVMQIDAAINAGNSGGPIIDNDGSVQAVVFAGIMGQDGLNFAIPVEYLKAELPILAAGGLRNHSWIGAMGRDVTKNEFTDSPQGLLTEYVMPGSSAFRAGLKVGDIVTAINGQPVTGVDSFHFALLRFVPGTIAELTVYSQESSEEKNILVYLEKRPEQPGYEIYQRDVISNSFYPIFGMKLTPISESDKKYSVADIKRGSIADETGFSQFDPVDVMKVQISDNKDSISAQIYTKKRKSGYFEVNLVIAAPLDSPYFF